MSAYNVRIINYVGGQQIRIYNKIYNDIANEINQERIIKEDNDLDSIEIWENINEYENELNDLDIILKNQERSKEVSYKRTINKIYEITRSNEWEYFVTLTFNPEKVNSFDYEEVVIKLSQWINNIKKRKASDIKYIFVPELHKSGRWHFHGLIANIGNIELIDSGHSDNTGNIIYNLGNYKLGWSTATKIKDMQKVSFYITKYISKELCSVTKNKKRYWCSRNLNGPLIYEYIMTEKEIEDMIDSLSDNITYCKTVENSIMDVKVKYLEISC